MGSGEAPTGLDWVQLRKEMDAMGYEETAWERIKRKCKDNPLVPVGATVTTGALSYGLYSFYAGRAKMQQYMMRLRVSAQLFTVLVAVGGIFLALPPEKRNFQELVKKGEPEMRFKK